MDIKYVIGILISIVTAIGILRNNNKVKLFFEKHEWADVILAGCFIVFAISLALYSNQQDKSTSMVGTLEPNTILLSTKDNIYPVMQLGQSKSILSSASGNILDLPNDQYIKILNEKNQLKLSTKIRGRDGLVAEIIDNNWKLKPNNLFDRNYNESALEVKDDGGVLFQIRLVGNRAIFQGIFYDVSGGWNAEFLGIPGLDFTPSDSSDYRQPASIKPFFKYPSDKFFGEIAD